MKIYFLFLLHFLLAPFGDQDQNSEKPSNIAAVEKSLSDFSAALAAADTASLKRLTGPTFVLLEEGRTFTFQEMILSIQQVFAAGGKMQRFPSNFHTEIRGAVAWSQYRVSGEFVSSAGTMQLSLLEAAVLEKDGEQWRIVQMATISAADK
jgi:SnoaL-like domain